MMDWIYTAISWILLRWHDLWNAMLGGGTFLGTNWDWILAIVFLVITIRIILFPIFVKQIRSQRAMQALQPKMKELQAKHKGDPQALREEMMKLYQTEKVNPLMGCLPMFLQIPVFLGLFHVLKRLNPERSGPLTELYTWTLDQFHAASMARLFNAPIASTFATGTATTKVVAGVLVIIMMTTTFLTSRQMILKTGWSADPQQRMIQKLMLYGIPISLLMSGWYFPIGVIIYWVTQNLFSLGQQYWVLHKYPPPVMENAIPVGAKRNGAAQTKRNAFQRFLSPTTRPVPNGAGASSSGLASAVRAGQRTGLFRRKSSAAEATAPQLEARSLAPKPGAKPVHPKQGAAESGAKASTPIPPASAAKAGEAQAGGATQPAKQAPVKSERSPGKPEKSGSAKRTSANARKRTVRKKGGPKR